MNRNVDWNETTNVLQRFCEVMLDPKVIIKSIIGGDNTYQDLQA